MQKSVEYYTRMTTAQMLDDFERELGPAYLGMFYNWADSTHDNAWSKAATRFTHAADRRFNKLMDELEYKREQAIYFSRLSELVAEFRKEKGLDETRLFLESFVS